MTVSLVRPEQKLATDPDICCCCSSRVKPLRHDIQAWWQPSPGYGYGPDGQSITLCLECIGTLQFFVEIGGPPMQVHR